MKRIIVFLAAAAMLFLSACFGPAPETREEMEARHEYELENAYYRGYDEGYDEAQLEYMSKIEDLQSALVEAAERANRISNMFDEIDEYTTDDIYSAVEDLRTFLWDNY